MLNFKVKALLQWTSHQLPETPRWLLVAAAFQASSKRANHDGIRSRYTMIYDDLRSYVCHI